MYLFVRKIPFLPGSFFMSVSLNVASLSDRIAEPTLMAQNGPEQNANCTTQVSQLRPRRLKGN